jgi:putative transposase
VEENGVKTKLEKHGIYPATYYSWKKKYEQMGKDGFRHGMTPAHIKEIKRLEKRLEKFYDTYNNKRWHGSIANLSPKLFWMLWDEGKISFKELKNKTLRFSLKVPYQQIPDNVNLREVPCLNNPALDEAGYL